LELLQIAQKFAAYHEAGHTVIASILKFMLAPEGMRISKVGGGLTRYCHREPGDKRNEPEDQQQRCLTIAALFAGIVAQRRLPEDRADGEDCWKDDRDKIEQLLLEMPTVNQIRLYKRIGEFGRKPCE
jgi:hypothetical protein